MGFPLIKPLRSGGRRSTGDGDWEGIGEGVLKSEKEGKQPPQKPSEEASGNKPEHVCQ